MVALWWTVKQLQEAGEGTSGGPSARWLRRRLIEWFRTDGRTFLWRQKPSPYHILIAELLLQRTRADLVEPYFARFLDQFPDAESVANADPEKVVNVLRPLGFLHRSRRLPALGRALVDHHGGEVPANRRALLSLPGVGDYIANAVLVLAFRRRAPLLDPNVIRVISRVFDIRSERARPRDDPKLWEFVHELVPRRGSAEFGLALVDLGAVVCRVRRPQCYECPLRDRCRAFGQGGVTPAER